MARFKTEHHSAKMTAIQHTRASPIRNRKGEYSQHSTSKKDSLVSLIPEKNQAQDTSPVKSRPAGLSVEMKKNMSADLSEVNSSPYL